MNRWFLMLGMLLNGTVLAAPLIASKAVEMRQAMDDLTAAALNHDMQVVKVQPIDSALVKRGYEDPHVRIVFVGSETAVRWAEAADPRLLNLLPLRLSLVQRGERIVVVADDLEPWKQEFKDSPGLVLLQAIEEELKGVLTDFVKQ
ncbi:MAG: hypothetical protein AB1421_12705 [Pseudomonadota bacterium]